MFGEFTVPAELHDAVYFDLLEAELEEVDFPEREVAPDFELEML